MFLFDAILPTLDVYGDASLVGPWYHYGYYRYAGLMTIPMALNYIFTFIQWCAVEKKSDKKWTWILVILQLWQQWRVLKVVILIFKKDTRARDKKRHY